MPAGQPGSCPAVPLLLPGAEPSEPGSSRAAVNSLKRDLTISKFRRREENCKRESLGFSLTPPVAQHLNFAEHPSIMQPAGLPRKASKILAPSTLGPLTWGFQDTQLGPCCPAAPGTGPACPWNSAALAPPACVWFSCAQPWVSSDLGNTTEDPLVGPWVWDEPQG